jgi:putative transposase
MPHTYTAVLVHAVFATGDRRRLLTADLRPRLHAYLGGVLRASGAHPVVVGGVEDHVHLLFDLPPTTAVADILRILKTNSSSWMCSEFEARFRWQRGYAAFSVSTPRRTAVSNYIRNQEQHHKGMSFESEYSNLLDAHGITVDPMFLWT